MGHIRPIQASRGLNPHKWVKFDPSTILRRIKQTRQPGQLSPICASWPVHQQNASSPSHRRKAFEIPKIGNYSGQNGIRAEIVYPIDIKRKYRINRLTFLKEFTLKGNMFAKFGRFIQVKIQAMPPITHARKIRIILIITG